MRFLRLCDRCRGERRIVRAGEPVECPKCAGFGVLETGPQPVDNPDSEGD